MRRRRDPGPRAVLFDFDGTLVDSRAAVIDCAGHALAALGLPAPPPARIAATIGLPLADAFRLLLPPGHHAAVPELVRRYRLRAEAVMTDITVVPAATRETLRRLGRRGLPLGIVSTKDRGAIEAILARAGLRQAFAVVVGGGDVAALKPDPAGLRLALDRLALPAGRALYVGDHLVDAAAARAAGVGFAAVLTGATPRRAFARCGVRTILRRLTQVLDLV